MDPDSICGGIGQIPSSSINLRLSVNLLADTFQIFFWIEYRENPMGLTEKAPRFSWKIESTIDTDAPEITEGNVIVKYFDKAVLTAQENEPVRITEKIVGKELIVTSKGEKFISVEKTPTSFRW